MCGLAQAASLPFILTLASMRTLGAFVSYSFLSRPGFGLMAELAIIVGVYVAINSIILALTIAAKWLIIGRTKPGRYPLWGLYFYRWWLVQQLTNLTGSSIFQRSPLMPVYLRAMGAAVGTDCQIGVVGSGAIDLLTIGNGTSLAAGVQFANAQVVGNELIIGSVSLGDDVYVGSSCVIGHDVVIGNGAELCDLTSIDSGQKIEDDQRWDGSPGRHIGRVQTEGLPPAAKPRRGRAAMLAVVHGLVGMVLLPGIVLLPMLPAFSIFDWVDRGVAAASSWYFPLYVLTVALPAAFTCIGVTLLLFTAVRWVILPRVRPGCYSVYSWFSLRYWIVGICSDMILEETLHGLFPTIYMRAWYRCMGTSIGRQAEISTSFGARLDLTHIGDQSFVADAVAFGGEELRRGWMILKPVKTQARVFVGNSAVVAPGTCVPAGALIGVGSKAPLTGMNPGDTWFGSPPMKLPLRQTFAEVSKNWTFEPSRFRQFARSLIEAFSLSLPMALLATLTITAVAASAVRSPSATWHVRLGLFALTALLIPIAMALFVVTAKWIIMGRYEPKMKPMWSWWALLTVRVDVLYSGVAAKMLLDRLQGTPMLPWMLRLFGSKIGKGTFMDTTDLTEFDCVQIGNFASLNAGSALQTHLYEDRIMKVGRLSIGDGATLGTASVILYDSTVGAFARLAPLTVVMKGESIPAHTEWQGAPAVRRQDRTGRCVS